MATFEVKAYELTIEEHPNADALELAKVGEYRSVVRRGQFKTGDLAIYIPEQAVLQDWLIEELGLVGRLAGKQKNRVKPVKLRGCLSQGLVYPLEKHPENVGWCFSPNGRFNGQLVAPGDDVTELMGIVKYEPPIPVHMAGEVFNAQGHTLKFDIENWKKYPDVFKDDESVSLTEKIHGTFILIGYHPEVDIPIVTSKGLSEKGLAFKFNEANKDNLYVRTFYQTLREGTSTLFPDQFEGMTILDVIAQRPELSGNPFYILGEVFGKKVQDFTYGQTQPQFRMFDIFVGEPNDGHYLSSWLVEHISIAANIPMVPVVYKGPFSREILSQHTSGRELVSKTGANIREGVVIRPFIERTDPTIGRVILKSVSDDYLSRGGKPTEYN